MKNVTFLFSKTSLAYCNAENNLVSKIGISKDKAVPFVVKDII